MPSAAEPADPAGPSSLGMLVDAAAGGDQGAWNTIVERFTALLWGIARSYRLGDADAADVVQGTWLKLLENLDRIEQPEALPGWLTTTARREALHLIKRRGRDIPVCDEDLGAGLADPLATELDLALLEDERDVALWAGFHQLSERCQRLLRVLMSCDRPSYQAVAASSGMPIGSIGPTRMRCLHRLEALLGASSYRFDHQLDSPGGVA